MAVVQAPHRTVLPQPGSGLGYTVMHRVLPWLGYQVGVAALHRAATSAAQGYGYPGFTAVSARLLAHAWPAGVRAPGVHVHIGLFVGGAAQLAQIEHTRLYFFYPSVIAGGQAAISFDATPGMRLVMNVPLRYDLRTDLAVSAGAGLELALQLPLLPTASKGRGPW